MSECLICYENNENTTEIIFLACLHSMCKICLSNLRQKVCPFCRTVISPSILANINETNHELGLFELFESPIRIRFRRQRRRIRLTTDTIDSTHGTILIETPQRINRENQKKGRWSTANLHSRNIQAQIK